MNKFTAPGSRPGPAEPPEAEIIGVAEARGGKRALELQVNISGPDQAFWLTFDALEGHGLSGPAAAAELRGIRVALEELVRILGPEKESRSPEDQSSTSSSPSR